MECWKPFNQLQLAINLLEEKVLAEDTIWPTLLSLGSLVGG